MENTTLALRWMDAWTPFPWNEISFPILSNLTDHVWFSEHSFIHFPSTFRKQVFLLCPFSRLDDWSFGLLTYFPNVTELVNKRTRSQTHVWQDSSTFISSKYQDWTGKKARLMECELREYCKLSWRLKNAGPVTATEWTQENLDQGWNLALGATFPVSTHSSTQQGL